MNRTIFVYWDAFPMPRFQEMCLSNIRRYNPTWNVVVLSQETSMELLGRLLPLGFARMTPQLQSDAVRLAALRRYGGVWIDITSLFVRQHGLQLMWDEMIAQGKELRGYTWMTDNILESWFIMALPNSLLLSQWHDLFLAYYEAREFADDILAHDLFRSIVNSYDVQRLLATGMSDYLSIHVAFLRLQHFNEWRYGRWTERVLLERGHERAYFVSGTICEGGFCMCSDPNFGGHFKGDRCVHDAFWSPTLSIATLAAHTPFLKLNGEITRSLNVVGREERLHDEPNSLLSRLLLPYTPYNDSGVVVPPGGRAPDVYYNTPQYYDIVHARGVCEGVGASVGVMALLASAYACRLRCGRMPRPRQWDCELRPRAGDQSCLQAD